MLLDFPEPMMLRDGDGLVLDDGSVVVVAGETEALVEISAKAPLDLVRLAWHIGNRHTDVQFTGKAFRIRRDHVLEEMVKGLGAAIDGGRGAVRSGAGCAAWASSRSWRVSAREGRLAARPRESGDPKPLRRKSWIPACAGMSGMNNHTQPSTA